MRVLPLASFLLFPLACGCATVQPRILEPGPGSGEAAAVRAIEAEGYHCRELVRDEWSHADARVVRTLSCTRMERLAAGTQVVYRTLSLADDRSVLHIYRGEYVAPDR